MSRILNKIALYVWSGLCSGILSMSFHACISIEIEENTHKRNILFYIGGDNNLGSEPSEKINEIRKGWQPEKGEMLIYVDQRNIDACLLRINGIQDANGYYGLDTLETYINDNSADKEVLKRVINKVVSDFPADSYGMLFFSHASGWLPEGMLARPRSLVIDNGEGTNREMEYYDFAGAIPDNQFDFIIFEACLMADVMTMYELRNKTQYVLASSAEIVSPGFTDIYRSDIMRLFDTRSAIPSALSGFAQSYYDRITSIADTNASCSATLGIIKMSEMQNLAAVVRTALNGTTIDETTLTVDSMQRFDRPRPNDINLITSGNRRSRYFDLGHVMDSLTTVSQYAQFNAQMNKTVVWKASTKRFLLENFNNGNPNYNRYDGYFIEHHSGLTTYIEQAVYPELNAAFRNSSWYRAILP